MKTMPKNHKILYVTDIQTINLLMNLVVAYIN